MGHSLSFIVKDTIISFLISLDRNSQKAINKYDDKHC